MNACLFRENDVKDKHNARANIFGEEKNTTKMNKQTNKPIKKKQWVGVCF